MDRLQMIFNRQKELMEKWHPVEKASGLLQTELVPVDLNSRAGQARIKDFAWRITEELGESLNEKPFTPARMEELIDGLHFLTELTILSGYDFNTVTDFEPADSEGDFLEMFIQDGKELLTAYGDLISYFLKELALLCNTLKNRPWKQSLQPVNVEEFKQRLENVWTYYFAILAFNGFDSTAVVEGYLNKANINQQRQGTGY